MNPNPTANVEDGFPGPEVCAFIEDEQARAYRKLGEAIGLGSDPMKMHERMSRPVMPASHATPEKFHAALANQGVRLSPEQAATNAHFITDTYARYFSRGVPTRFEDPNRYPTLAMIFDGLHATLAAKGQAILPRPYLATLPSGQVDAHVARERKTRSPVVFFERGLFQYLNDFALLMGWAMPAITIHHITNDAALGALLPRHMIPPPASGFFVASLLAYVVDGNPGLSRSPIPRPEHNIFLVSHLLAHMEQFVMAHELAHISLGHLNRKEGPDDEFEADAHGCDVVTTLSRQEAGSWAMGYWGVDLFFIALNFLYLSLGLLAFGPEKLQWISASHPDPLKRRARIAARTTNDPATSVGASAAKGLTSMTEAICQRLWELARPQLLLAYHAGARPSPLWKDLVTHTFASREP